MKMKELLEAKIIPQGVEPVNVEVLKDLLYSQCSEFMANNAKRPLFRGTQKKYEPIVIIDPTVGLRKSRVIKNHYTLLMDNSPYYQGWPKRSKSVVCSTSYSYAADFAKFGTRVIVPFNGSKIGITPYADIWATPVDLSKVAPELKYFNHISYLLEYFKVPDNSYEVMLEYMQTPDFHYNWKERFPNIDLNDFDLIGYLHKVMSPEKTGMQLSNTENFKRALYLNKECWVGGKCLSIKPSVYEQIVGTFIK